ncbi:unnamed protein product [Symbiodinium sp. CCMP2592]|nr:unnamed protein product [Symbiodinium sp. CCMP2592]
MRCLATAALLALVVCLATLHLCLFTAWYSFGRKLFTRTENVHFKDIELAIEIARASPTRDTQATSQERRLALLFMLRTHLVEIEVWRRWLQPETGMTGGSEQPRVSLYFHVTDLQAAGPEVVKELQALPGARKIIPPVATGWCELMAAEVALLQAALLDDPGRALTCELESQGFWMRAAAFAQVHWQWKKLFATMCFFQTDRVCMDKASASALRGGVAAAMVQAICVPAFMWMRTVTNYQYRHGGRVLDVARRLYAEGGPRRFYRGVVPALLQSPVLRFGGLAVNEGLLSVTANYSVSHTATAALSSAAATGLKILLMPLDAWQTAKQVNGQQGLALLMIEAKKRPLSLWRGTAGCLTGTWVAHYAWCFTNNYLHDALPTSAFGNSEMARGASIGFISNVAGDCCSNFLRVLKVIRQTAGGSISYHEAVKEKFRAASSTSVAEHKQNMLSLSDASTASPAALPHEHGVALLYQAFLIGYEADKALEFGGHLKEGRIVKATALEFYCGADMTLGTDALPSTNPQDVGTNRSDASHWVGIHKLLQLMHQMNCPVFTLHLVGQMLCSDEVLPLLALALAEEHLPGNTALDLSDLELYQKATLGLQQFEDGIRDLGARSECILYAPWPGCGAADQADLKRAKSPLLGGGLLPADRDALLHSLADKGVLFARKLGTVGGNVTAHLAMLQALDVVKRPPKAPHRLFPISSEERGGPVVLARWFLASLKARMPPAAIVVLCGLIAVFSGQMVPATGIVTKRSFTVFIGVYAFAHFVVFFVSVAAFVEYSLLEPTRPQCCERQGWFAKSNSDEPPVETTDSFKTARGLVMHAAGCPVFVAQSRVDLLSAMAGTGPCSGRGLEFGPEFCLPHLEVSDSIARRLVGASPLQGLTPETPGVSSRSWQVIRFSLRSPCAIHGSAYRSTMFGCLHYGGCPNSPLDKLGILPWPQGSAIF